MTSLALVTVLVPARNEAADIPKCLARIRAQDYPHDLLEVLVVDGASSDGTAERASLLLQESDFRHAAVMTNAEGSTPSNLNRGLAGATGEILCRVDARSLIPPDYVSRCVDLLTSMAEVVVVGGSQIAVPPRQDAVGRGIARALNNRWAMGLSRYRRGAQSGPTDTVYLGAFRTEEVRKAGGWDERLSTNQDFDLNRRLGQLGTVWFESSLGVGYVPRSTLPELFRQYRRFGRWKVRYWRLTHERPQARQLALLTAPVAAASLLAVTLACRPALRLPSLATVVLAASALELRGADEPASGSVATHAEAMLAMAAVAGGWLTGVWSELLSRRGRA
jgi:succinoglycan biosynthesis protein ExoA